MAFIGALLAFCGSLLLYAMLAMPWASVAELFGADRESAAGFAFFFGPFLSLFALAGVWKFAWWLRHASPHKRRTDISDSIASLLILGMVVLAGLPPSFLLTEAICVGGSGNGCGELADPSHALPLALVMIAAFVVAIFAASHPTESERELLVAMVPLIVASVIALAEVAAMPDGGVFGTGLFFGVIPTGVLFLYLIAVTDDPSVRRGGAD